MSQLDTPDVEKPLDASPSAPTLSHHGSTSPVNQANKPTQSFLAQYSRKKKIAICSGLTLLLLILVVVLPVSLTVGKRKPSNNSSGNDSGPGPGADFPNNQPDGAKTGGDGTTVYLDDGTQFTYTNKFGGYWYYDPADPFHNGARCQSWVPALNETWRWGRDTVRGVNLGGWLVLEPFISPALFEKYTSAAVVPLDEYGLMEAKRADGSLGDIEKHYQTFITEKDFAEIAGAGLNWIRLPIPFWAVATFDGEPYLEGVAWKYVIKAFQWARKYGLRINLDLHTHPGSQNGWNHSGYGRGPLSAGWLNGVMGIANAQRSLDYIRIITEFITQPQYSPVVPMFGIVNEPRLSVLSRSAVEDFYFEAYKIIREITGVGEGKGPFVSIHDGFLDTTSWNTFLTGADRLAIDTHPYFAFDGDNNFPLASYVPRPCSRWGASTNTTQQTFGVITAGEWSVAINDCGLFVTGVQGAPTFAGDCTQWDHWENWDQATKNQLLQFAMTSMDSLQNWFFWTWKIGPSSVDGAVRSPFWSYKLGLENGWLPKDPRDAIGQCALLGQPPTNPFSGNFQPWQTGGVGANQFRAGVTDSLVWPPTSLSGIPGAAYLPTYTPTGTPIVTLPGPHATAGIDGGDGWFDDDDKTPMMTPIPACSYPPAYLEVQLPAPLTPFCGGPTLNIPLVDPTTVATSRTTTGLLVPTTDPLIPTTRSISRATDPIETDDIETLRIRRVLKKRLAMPTAMPA